MQTLWKIYFWLLAVYSSTLVLIVLFLAPFGKVNISDLVIVLLPFLGIIAVYSYAHKRFFFSRKTWLIMLCSFIVGSLYYSLVQFTTLRTVITIPTFLIPHIGSKSNIVLRWLAAILALPQLFAFYHLVFKQKKDRTHIKQLISP